ncbi:MAG: Methionyl-tRNA synthetase [Bacteroidota bacterium]
MEQKQNITFDTYLSLDIRVCQVLEAERVPKTDKLLKLKINTGIDERECVTNLGGLYQPEDFINKKIPFILNLEPTTIKKIESKAMIFIPDTKGDIFNAYNEYETGEIIFTK